MSGRRDYVYDLTGDNDDNDNNKNTTTTATMPPLPPSSPPLTRLVLADQRMDFDDEFDDGEDEAEPTILVDPLLLLPVSGLPSLLPMVGGGSVPYKNGKRTAQQSKPTMSNGSSQRPTTTGTKKRNRGDETNYKVKSKGGSKPPAMKNSSRNASAVTRNNNGQNKNNNNNNSGTAVAKQSSSSWNAITTTGGTATAGAAAFGTNDSVKRQRQDSSLLNRNGGGSGRATTTTTTNSNKNKNNINLTATAGGVRKMTANATGRGRTRREEWQRAPSIRHEHATGVPQPGNNNPAQSLYSNPAVELYQSKGSSLSSRPNRDGPFQQQGRQQWDREMELDRLAQVQAWQQQELDRQSLSLLKHREGEGASPPDHHPEQQGKAKETNVSAATTTTTTVPNSNSSGGTDTNFDEQQRRQQSRELVREKAKLQKAIADHELRVERDKKQWDDKIQEQSQALLVEKNKLCQALADHALRIAKDKKEIEQLKEQARDLTKEKEMLQKAAADRATEMKKKQEETDQLRRQVYELTNAKAKLQKTLSECDERIKRSDHRVRAEWAKLEQERNGFFQETRRFRWDRDAFRTFAQEERSKFQLMQSQFETEKLEHLRTVNQRMTDLSTRDEELVRRKKELDEREKNQEDAVAAFESYRVEADIEFVRRDEALALTQAFLDTEVEDIAKDRQSVNRLKQRLANQQQQLDTAKQAAEAKHAKQRKDLEDWISKAELTLRQQEESLSKREELLQTKDAELSRREMAQKRRASDVNHLRNSRDNKRVKLEEKNTENESTQPEKSTSSTSGNVKDHGQKQSPEPSQNGSHDVNVAPPDQGFVLVDSDSDDSNVCQKKQPCVRPKPGGFDTANRFNSYLDNDKATEMQEKAFQEAAAKFRSRQKGNIKASFASMSRTGPPTITDPMPDISTRYPNHWTWTDPHARLGLPTGAHVRLVKKQYRTLARLYHPDKSQLTDTGDRFNAVSAAYHHLLNTR